MLTLALAWLSSNRTTVPLAGSTRLLLQCLVTLCQLINTRKVLNCYTKVTIVVVIDYKAIAHQTTETVEVTGDWSSQPPIPP